MQARLSQLAELTQGVLTGDPNQPIAKAAPLHTADATSITFAERPDRLDWNAVTQARAVVVPFGTEPPTPEVATIQVADVKEAFEKIVVFFRPPRPRWLQGVSERAVVSPTAKIGPNVAIGPNAVVGADVEIGAGATIHPGVVLQPGVKIGENSTLFPNVVVYEDCVVGKNCLLHANCVVGAYGFGYDSSTGVHALAAQFGNVVIEDNVEIGACATVDRGAYDSTVIGEGTKIDNHVMIAHNCKIGKRNMICASVGIAGSVTTGDYVVMAGRVGLRDHIRIGDGAALGAMAGVMGDVPAGARVVGIPATPEKEQMRKQVAFAKLPDALKQLKALQKEVETLKARLEATDSAE